MSDFRNPEKMILCSATIIPQPVKPQPGELLAQIYAAKKAGFAGISMWAFHEMVECIAGRSSEQTQSDLRDASIAVPLVETIMPWDVATAAEAVSTAKPIFESCKLFGAHSVAAVSLSSESIAEQKAVSHLRAVCELADEYGLTVVTEFLPWSGIPTLASLANILAKVDCDNAGIVLDAWHWQRQPGGPSPDVLREIKPQQLSVFQLCDAAANAEADPIDECMHRRLLPGGGVIDFAEIFSLFDEIGANPLIAPEVFNEQQSALGADIMAVNIYRSSAKVLSNTETF